MKYFTRTPIAAVLICCSVLSGCAASTKDTGTVSSESTNPPGISDTTSTSTQPAETESNQGDETGLPKEMGIRIENGRYVYNPYRLSAETMDNMGDGFAAFYVDFVTAYLNYETSCPCPDEEYAMMLSTILYYEFPLFSADGELKGIRGYSDGKLNWEYTESREKHESLVDEFTQSANSFLKDVSPAQSEQLRAETIYHDFCPLMTYDYEVLETRKNVDAYYAYINHRGVCVTFATAYSQLLTQVGVENTLATGSDPNGLAHLWNTVTLDGQKYFCDPTYELNYKHGNAFVYFGMTLEDRLSDGTKADYIGRYSSVSVSEVELAKQTLQIIPLGG